MNRALRFRVCVSVVFVVCLCLTLFGVASAQSYNLGGKTVSFLHGGLVTVFDSPRCWTSGSRSRRTSTAR